MRWWAAALVLAACGDNSALPSPDADNHLPSDAATVDAPAPDAALADALPPNILFVSNGRDSHPTDIAVDSVYVYWTDSATPGRIMRTAKTTGDTQALATLTSGNLWQIAIDDSNIYWTSDAGLQTMPKGGTQVMTLYAPVHRPLAADTDALYFVDAAGIVRLAKTGGSQHIATDIAISIVAGSFGVVWSNGTDVRRLSAGTQDTLVSNLNEVDAVGADDTSAYFAENAPNLVPRIGSVSYAGHTIQTLLQARSDLYLPRIVPDGANLYYCATTVLYRVMQTGGATDLYDGALPLGYPASVAVDATDVYVAGFALGGKFSEHGSIFRLPK